MICLRDRRRGEAARDHVGGRLSESIGAELVREQPQPIADALGKGPTSSS